MKSFSSCILNSKIEIRCSDRTGIATDNLDELFAYLVSKQEGFNICWDVDVFVAPILKVLSIQQVEDLFNSGRISIGKHTIIYNQGKSLRISLSYKNAASFYWIKQYYQEDEEPSLDDIKVKGEIIITELAKIGINPKKLTSSVAIFENIFDQLNLPTYKDIPVELCKWTWGQKGRAWTEAFKLGHFDMCTDLDINSCFPSIMADLYDTRYGTIVHSKEIPAEAEYVFARGILDTSDYFTPFVYANEYGHLFSPRGKREAILSKQGLAYLKEYDAGTFELQDAFSWVPTRKFKPMHYTVNKIFNQRSGNYSRPVKRIFKGALNGIYGRFYQEFRDGTLGKQVNPIWGFLIEDGARLKIAEYIKNNHLEKDILAINTDGILLEGDYNIESSTKMGEWRIDNKGPALIVSSGTVFFADKKPSQVYYHEAMDMIRCYPEAIEWHKKAERLITIGDALQGWSEELGSLHETSPGFSLIFDHDRYYPSLPQTGGELLNRIFPSQPIDASSLVTAK